MTSRSHAKKIISISVLSLSILGIMGCSTKKTETTNADTTSDANAAITSTVDAKACKEAIAAYLEQSKSSTDGEAVKKGATISVDYVGRLDDQTVFDTSVESVAKACGKYAAGRDYKAGLSFTVGGGNMIAGFDKGVEGMKVGETKTITIAAKDAYGERDKKRVVSVPKTQIPGSESLKVGMQVQASNGQPFKVTKVDKDTIELDGNHELAGKTLIFDITVKSIQK